MSGIVFSEITREAPPLPKAQSRPGKEARRDSGAGRARGGLGKGAERSSESMPLGFSRGSQTLVHNPCTLSFSFLISFNEQI